MTLIDSQKVIPSFFLRRSRGVPTSKLSTWPKQDTDIGASVSSTTVHTVHSHSNTSGTSKSPNSLSSSSDHKSSTTSLGLHTKAQKDDDDVYFPKVRQGRSNIFAVSRKRGRFETPGSPLVSSKYSSDSGPSATSLRLQDHGKKGPQGQLSSLHRSEVFVRCDMPDKNSTIEYYTQQTGGQHSSSTPTPQPPPFVVSESSEIVNSPTTFHDHDNPKGTSSLARVPDIHLGHDLIIPRNDTARRRPSKKNILLDEDRILVWLEDVSKAMDENQQKEDVPLAFE